VKDIYLSEFKPTSEAIVEKNEYTKPKFPVIDVHMHMGKLLLGDNYNELYTTSDFINRMKDIGVVKICNLDGFWGIEFDKMLIKTKGYESKILNFIWIDLSGINESDFAYKTRKYIIESVKKGARGIKMWKDISLPIDSTNSLIRTDDKRLDVIYDTAASADIPILIHIADPVAFFKPSDAYNERYEELQENPQWSFYEKGCYSFEQLMDMQDNMIGKHPDTKFIVAHFGSYAENLKHVDERLERYPNMFIDISGRIAELGRVPDSARRFFIKNKERILFGSDCTPLSKGEQEIIYRFLESNDEYFPYWTEDEVPRQGRWHIYGLGLPDDVLEHIYYKNAANLLKV